MKKEVVFLTESSESKSFQNAMRVSSEFSLHFENFGFDRNSNALPFVLNEVTCAVCAYVVFTERNLS